jgi:hypothetical protein
LRLGSWFNYGCFVCAAQAPVYIVAGRVTPSAVGIFLWLAFGFGSFVTVFFSSTW